GGARIEQAAARGDPTRFALPRPMQGRPGCHFSFAGLKTALRQQAERLGPAALEPPLVNDLAASFQAAAVDALIDRTGRAVETFLGDRPPDPTLVVAGGVAANRLIRDRLERLAGHAGIRLVVPPPALCTDNAVMVAWAGLERLALGLVDPFDVPARARWPLDPDAEPAIGAGIKA
ncbi:MAG TPA: tRNA (adenosine(37)-N6)-threonylcarbamoyltransferase complex transferase subunit TsaD, partial [Geminicoccaceae bacterium]